MPVDDQGPFNSDPISDADHGKNEEPAPESPASVVFMEMMRQTAARKVAEQEAAGIALSKAVEPAVLNPPQKYATPEERKQAAAMEAQRLRRVQRKEERRRDQRVGLLGGLLRSVIVVGVSAVLIATILSWWTRPEALNLDLRAQLVQADSNQIAVVLPTIAPTPNFLRRIGIVSGHYGKPPDDFLTQFDPGAVCDDGLTENSINFEVATRVVVRLRDLGYSVDLLEEFDGRMADYQADLLVSIHSNDCTDYGEIVSGFLVAQADARPTGGPDEKLVNCLAKYYGELTGLPQRFGLTRDMTDYHIFREINPRTPGAILELGFMRADREILTQQPDLLADAIVQGIMCFLDPNETPMIPIPAEASPSPAPQDSVASGST